ncbi:hypothetical protein X757_07230 [Mesorhizobium sp. LSHC414A00]|nr:hypothetical protein X757_07230 [Mesorhizobium sp. LSHC414A00]
MGINAAGQRLDNPKVGPDGKGPSPHRAGSMPIEDALPWLSELAS